MQPLRMLSIFQRKFVRMSIAIVATPCEVVRTVDAEEFKGTNLFHFCSVDVNRGVLSLLFLLVAPNHLYSFVNGVVAV